MEKFAAVSRDMAGNGALVKMDPVKHVRLTSTKSRNKVFACDVLLKLPPYLSPKIVSVRVDYLGMG